MAFSLNIHHYHHYPELDKMSEQLENIRREVEEAKTAASSAVALILGLKAKLDELLTIKGDYEALRAGVEALSTDLSDSTDNLAAAVAANTEAPAEPAPVDPIPADPAPPADGGEETSTGGGEEAQP